MRPEERQNVPYHGARKGRPDWSLEEIWATPKGLALNAVSHRVVGKRYLVFGFLFFLFAGFLALLIRTQLIVPHGSFLSEESYNQIFTMHGSLMMFIFAIPILEGFAIYLIPQMIGARDLIFPRLGAYGFYCFVLGGGMLVLSVILGMAPNGGWFMYTPLSTREYAPGINADVWLIGVTFAEIASVTGAIEIIAAILCSRAPGMSLFRMPIICWYFLATAFMIAVGFPPLIMASVLLEIERAFGFTFFDPALGGDPLLWQHLFWIFGHPEVYIIFLPAAGMVATMIPTFVGKPFFGYGLVVAAIISMAFLSFGLWVHHMYATGLPAVSLSFFSAASMAVAIPTGIQIFAYIATLSQGRPRLEPPMLFIIAFFIVFVIGGLTGIMVAAASFDWQAHDTYFIVAHLHYVLVGGMVFPVLGAVYYWMPQIVGRFMSRTLAHVVFWLTFIGFNVAFLPMHITGLRGMPRRVATYPEGLGWDWLNLVSTIGAYVLGIGFALFALDVLRVTMGGGKGAPRNPWGASTLEWLYPPVTPGYNFRLIPRITSRDPLWQQDELKETWEPSSGYLAVPNDGRRETIGSDPISGAPIQIARLPHPTWWPLASALATGLAFVALLFSQYWLAFGGAALTLMCFTSWAWEPSDSGVVRPAGHGLNLPVNIVTTKSHLWIGMAISLIILVALYFSLYFAYFFLWTAQNDFLRPAVMADQGSNLVAALAALVMILASRAAWASVKPEDHEDRRVPDTLAQIWLGMSVVASMILAGASLVAVWQLDFTASAHASVVWSLHGFVALLAAIGGYCQLFSLSRVVLRLVPRAGAMPVLQMSSYQTVIGVLAILTFVTTAYGPTLLAP